MRANNRNPGGEGQEPTAPARPPRAGSLLITCPRGLAPFLRAEVEALGLGPVRERPAGVECAGTLADAPRLNLFLRTGHRVLVRLADFRAATTDALYAGVRDLPWETHFDPDGRFFVNGSARHPCLRDPRFALLRAKDAVADRMRMKCGRRPDSGPGEEGAAGLFVHWSENGRVQVYLDTTGRPLNARGYRRVRTDAPLQETLGAALVRAAGWTPERPLVCPMCGSGTFAIEAAWMARGRAPGLDRADFSFLHLRGFDAAAWEAMRAEARRAERPRAPSRILATDADPRAIEAARANAEAAGVAADIEFRVCDFAATETPPGAVILMNPAYGVRTGEAARLPDLYRRIGAFLQSAPADARGFVFTSDEALARAVGLEPVSRRPFWNGPLACTLYEYAPAGPGLAGDGA